MNIKGGENRTIVLTIYVYCKTYWKKMCCNLFGQRLQAKTVLRKSALYTTLYLCVLFVSIHACLSKGSYIRYIHIRTRQCNFRLVNRKFDH